VSCQSAAQPKYLISKQGTEGNRGLSCSNMTKFVIPLLEAITMQASSVILKGDQSVIELLLESASAEEPA
jgi:hypothetical protein